MLPPRASPCAPFRFNTPDKVSTTTHWHAHLIQKSPSISETPHPFLTPRHSYLRPPIPAPSTVSPLAPVRFVRSPLHVPSPSRKKSPSESPRHILISRRPTTSRTQAPSTYPPNKARPRHTLAQPLSYMPRQPTTSSCPQVSKRTKLHRRSDLSALEPVFYPVYPNRSPATTHTPLPPLYLITLSHRRSTLYPLSFPVVFSPRF